MKKRLCSVMLLLAMSLAGCSSGSKGVLEVKDGVIYNNGTATTVTVHNGDTAQEPFSLNPSLTIEFSTHSDFGNCDHNPQGVAVGNVTKSDRDKSITYFASYGGSQYTMHKEISGGFLCAYLYSPDTVQIDVAINQLTNAVTSLSLGNFKKARMGLIELHDFSSITATQSSILIDKSVSVFKGTVATTETKEFNKVQVGYLPDSAYDYYQYGEYLVQALKGYDISSCITFLKE